MRIAFSLLLSVLAFLLVSCDDLVLFSQQVQGSDPINLEGRYVLEFPEEDGSITYDTLDFHRILPYRFIVYSSLAEVPDGIVYQGQIHQRGDDYFLSKQDEETKKWEISSFRLRGEGGYNLISAFYLKEHNDQLIDLIKDNKLKVLDKYERPHDNQESYADGDSTFTVYEVKASQAKIVRTWRKILRKTERQVVRKLNEIPQVREDEGFEIILSPEPLLYPNPSSDQISLELPHTGAYELMLFSLDGKLLREASFEGNSHQMNIQQLANGAYLLKVVDRQQGFQQSWRLIKE